MVENIPHTLYLSFKYKIMLMISISSSAGVVDSPDCSGSLSCKVTVSVSPVFTLDKTSFDGRKPSCSSQARASVHLSSRFLFKFRWCRLEHFEGDFATTLTTFI